MKNFIENIKRIWKEQLWFKIVVFAILGAAVIGGIVATVLCTTSHPSSTQTSNTTTVSGTTATRIVNITDANGATVTDANGENVTSIVTITEATTVTTAKTSIDDATKTTTLASAATTKKNNTTKPTTTPTNKPSATTTAKAPQTQPTKTQTHTHSYSSKVVAATCDKGGYTLHTCSCGDSYTDNATAALGHNLYEWDHRDARVGSAGYTVYRCTRCDYERVDEIPALPETTMSAAEVEDFVNSYLASKGFTIMYNYTPDECGYNPPWVWGAGDTLDGPAWEGSEYTNRESLIIYIEAVLEDLGADGSYGEEIRAYAEPRTSQYDPGLRGWLYILY